MYRSKKEIQFASVLSRHFCNFETNAMDVAGTPDVFFRNIELAIFFNGCFWHSHYCKLRNLNSKWQSHLESIKGRDQVILEELSSAGIATLTVWECEWEKNPNRQIEKIFNYITLSENYGIKVRNKSVSSVSSIVA